MEKHKKEISAGFLFLALVMVFIVEYLFFVFGRICGIQNSFTSEMKLIFASRIAETVILIMALCLYYDPALMGLDKTGIKKGIIKGILWSAFFGVLAFSAISILWLKGFRVFDFFRINNAGSYGDIFWLYAAAAMAGPVAEEIFFRGVVFGYFRKYGFTSATAASTLLFVSAHSTSGIPFPQIAGGLVFAFLYEKTGSIMTSITVHISGNFAIFTIGFMDRFCW